MSNDDQRAEARLAFTHAALDSTDVALVSASADAGFRSYWRTSGITPSRIVMDSPPGLDDPRAWLAVRDLLAAGDVRVPQMLASDLDQGFLLLEDLGRQTLLDVLENGRGSEWIDQAMVELLRLQAVAPPSGFPRYDRALLLRELGLFDQWFLARHLGLDDATHTGLAGVYEFLVESALAQPQVLTHRDFMARNLMPQADGRLAVIDFQDAVVGPVAYDLLSLCRDAFLSWPQAQVDAWCGSYLERACAAGLSTPAPAQFRRDFDLIGVQRHLKVLGIFARLRHRDGKPRYLADAPRFLSYLDAVIPHYPELAPLAHLLEARVAPAMVVGTRA